LNPYNRNYSINQLSDFYIDTKELLKLEQRIIELDVREDLKKKQEPFQKIMEAIKELKGENDIFILHAPFKPTPLFAILKAKGFTHEAEEIEKKHWKVTFVKRA
jgi:hypothetical protein